MARSVINDIERGGLIINEDNQAIASGAPEVLPVSLRTLHDSVLADLQLKHTQAHDAEDICHNRVEICRATRKACQIERRKIQLFVKATHDEIKVEAMLGMLNLDKKTPRRNVDAVQCYIETAAQFANYDGTPDAIPEEYKTRFNNALAIFEPALVESGISRGETNSAYQHRDHVHRAYIEILTRVRAWLIMKLPNGIKDARLAEYGFNPRDEMTHLVPTGIEGFTAQWDTETKSIALRWIAAENANSYETFFALKPADPDETPKFKRYSKTKHLYYHFSGLKTGQAYLFKVRGITHYRKGEFSPIVEVAM